MKVATCIGCHCDDLHACEFGCSWLELDRRAGLGVCSECPGQVDVFKDMRRRCYFVPIRYRICCLKSTPAVEGFAVRLPAPFTGLRFCVRLEGGDWTIDHYDSGYSVIGPVMDVLDERPEVLREVRRWARDGRSRARVVRWLMRYLRHAYLTGRLRQAMGGKEYGWCLEEAGL